MDAFIPKEKLTAYERWELAAFNEQEEQRAAPAAAPEPPPASSDKPLLPLPTPEEIESLRADAREVGKGEGFAAGFAAGRDEGLAFVRREADRLRTIGNDFQAALTEAEDKFADNLLSLALDIARQVVRGSVQAKPELILPVVREAISMLASQHGRPVLYVSPDDAELVRSQIGEQFGHTGWRLSEDTALGRGECRVDNAGSEIDATLATRWRRVVEAIGARSDWLDDSE